MPSDTDSNGGANAHMDKHPNAHCNRHCHSNCNRDCNGNANGDCASTGLHCSGSGRRSNLHANANEYAAPSGAGGLMLLEPKYDLEMKLTPDPDNEMAVSITWEWKGLEVTKLGYKDTRRALVFALRQLTEMIQVEAARTAAAEAEVKKFTEGLVTV